MLPGLRFLFIATVLTMSMLIFGLGAASLLRSAHEEFTSLPNKRPQPEPVFAQPAETTRPTLALLRVDTPPPEQNGADSQGAPIPAGPLSEQPAPLASTAVEPAKTAEADMTTPGPESVAALNITAPAEEKSGAIDKPSEPAAAVPTPADSAARAGIGVASETRAAPEPAPPAVVEPRAPAAEPAAAAASDSAKAAALKIATLGGPEVTIDAKVAAKPPVAAAAKRAQNRHRIKRRRIVRPRPVPPQPMTLGLFEPLPTDTRQTGPGVASITPAR